MKDVAEALLEVAEILMADVGDVEVIEPTGSTPVKTRQTKKMKDAGLRMAVSVPRDILDAIEDAAIRASGVAAQLGTIQRTLDREDVGAAASAMNRMSPAVRRQIPDEVRIFIESVGKKLPSSEGWKASVLRDMEEVMTDGNGADHLEYSEYLTYTDGTSNKFHYFAVFRYSDDQGQILYAGGNAYGRIGKRAKIVVIAQGKSPHGVISAVQRKQMQKERKGYE